MVGEFMAMEMVVGAACGCYYGPVGGVVGFNELFILS